jgi:outer membrane protein OmpA-like peptidoglycan-associated protein
MRRWAHSGIWAISAVLLCSLPAARADEPPASGSAPARAPLQVSIDKSKVDLKEHHLELSASRDLARVTLKVTGESGAILADVDRTLSTPHPAGRPLVVAWQPSSEEPVTRIEVFAYDMEDYYKGIALTPWSIAIPHEEVNFKKDSSQIDDPEKPKLETSFTRVTDALAKHPELHPTLFIAGNTDTVGDASYNLRLSRLRAQSISSWFRQRGLHIPIAFEGFGESALLIKTADEVDEPRNRRVDYILAIDEPTMASGVHPSWHRVP